MFIKMIDWWAIAFQFLFSLLSSLCHHHTYNERPKPKVVLVLVIWISQITSNAITTRGLEYYFWRTVIFFCGCPRPLPRIRGFYNFHFSIGSIHQMKRQIATQHLLVIPFLVWIYDLCFLAFQEHLLLKMLLVSFVFSFQNSQVRKSNIFYSIKCKYNY